MTASSGTSSETLLPLTLVPTHASSGGASAKAGSASFEDIFQQEGGADFTARDSKGKTPFAMEKVSEQQAPSSATTLKGKSQEPGSSTTSQVASSGKSLPAPSGARANIAEEKVPSAEEAATDEPPALPVEGDLSAMMVRASILTSNAQAASISKAPSAPDAKTVTEPGDDTKATREDTSFSPNSGEATMSAVNVHAPTRTSNAEANSHLKAPSAPTAKTPSEAENDAETTAAKNSFQPISGGPDMSAMIVQASIRSLNAQTPSLSKAPSVPPAKTATKAGNDTETAAPKNSFQPISGGADMSAMIVQASILASNAQATSLPKAASAHATNTADGLGNELPLSGLDKGLTTSPAKEKKSASASAEGSFIQSDTAAPNAGSSSLGMLGSPLAGAVTLTGGQQLTTGNGAGNLSLSGLSGSASSIGGTANVKNEKAMNTELNFPEIFSGYGTNTLSQQAPADLHILLSSNHDFEDALQQVMHVAQLTQTNSSRAPMRVEIEIQTPPGAIVNVYVSRQNDQWRAQLSTNDPQALSWVQDKMSSLRQSGDFAVEVRWLPPQMESSSGHNPNLSWDRGGQGQSNYQQPDERQQSQRQKKDEAMPDLASILSSPFANTLHALGRAA